MSATHSSKVSRRRFLEASAATVATASVAGVVSRGAAAGTQAPEPRAGGAGLLDAVLDAFKTHRLVGLGESHGLQNHHDALALLLSDPRIPEVVDDIVIEFGNARYQPRIDQFIAGEPVDNADLRAVWRNTTQSPEETWDEPVYEQFFHTVRAINWTLPPGRQMRVLAGDPPINWAKTIKLDELLRLADERDSHAASVVHEHVLNHGRRALICYGTWHLLHTVSGNLATVLKQRTGERAYTIFDLTYTAGDSGGLAKSLAPYPRDTVIPTASSWLGSFDTGLIPPTVAMATPNRTGPHGTSGKPKPKLRKSNPWCGVPLGSLVDAGLYMGQPQDLTASWWNPAIYLNPAYWKELQRRNTITPSGTNLEMYRREQPARYPLLELPRAAECRKA